MFHCMLLDHVFLTRPVYKFLVLIFFMKKLAETCYFSFYDNLSLFSYRIQFTGPLIRFI